MGSGPLSRKKRQRPAPTLRGELEGASTSIHNARHPLHIDGPGPHVTQRVANDIQRRVQRAAKSFLADADQPSGISSCGYSLNYGGSTHEDRVA